MDDKYHRYREGEIRAELETDDDFNSAQTEGSQRMKAFLYMNISAVFACIGRMLIKFGLHDGVEPLDFMMVKVLTNALFAYAVILVNKESIHVSKEYWGGIMVRTLLGYAFFALTIYSLEFLPITISGVVSNTSPFWAGIMAYLILRERLSNFEVACMMASFLGVIIVIFSSEEPHKSKNKIDIVSQQKFHLGLLLVFIGSLCHAGIALTARYLKQVNYSVISFHYGWSSAVLGLIALVIEHFWQGHTNFRLLNYPGHIYLFLLFSSLISSVELLLGTLACQLAKTGVIQSLHYMMVVYSLGIDMLVFGVDFTVL